MKGKKGKKELTVTPVVSYKGPRYPDRSSVESDPSILLENVPMGWLKKPLAAGALLAFVMGGYSPAHGTENVRGDKKEKRVETGKQAKEKDEKQLQREQLQQKQNAAAVAPLFLYGTGSGSLGCVVVSPPSFLPENEALDLIIAELKNHGFRFGRREQLVEGLTISSRRARYNVKTYKYNVTETGDKSLFYFDLYDEKTNIGIKYITDSNYYKLGGPWSGSSVSSYDMVDVAQGIRETLKEHYSRSKDKKFNAVVFYDPMAPYKGSGMGRSEAVVDLLKQVREFARWWQAHAPVPGAFK